MEISLGNVEANQILRKKLYKLNALTLGIKDSNTYIPGITTTKRTRLKKPVLKKNLVLCIPTCHVLYVAALDQPSDV